MFSYLITLMGGVFWVFRLIVASTYSLGIDFPIIPFDINMEVILLFVTIICMIFIIKRNIFGALVYFVGYGLYFGNDLYSGIVNILKGQAEASSYLNVFISLLGILIPFFIVMDIFLNKDRKGNAKDRKTDWYYNNKDYDRDLDERADKNQYKF